jgi:hypothetical protein
VSEVINVRELLARLNPKTCRFDIGQGGIPELTNIDIAGALGMVPAGLGRDLLIYLHWPAGAEVDREKILDAIAARTHQEYARRESFLVLERLELHFLEDKWAARAHHTDAQRREIDRARGAVEAAKLVTWPNQPDLHVRLRQAVLDELRAPNHCRECDGRGALLHGNLMTTCSACGGRGTVAVSDRQRADRMGRDESNYRRSWRGMYEWTWRLLVDEEQRAGQALATAVGWSRLAA